MTRFASFTADGGSFYGVVAGDGAIALSDVFPQWPSLREVIEDGGLHDLAIAAQSRDVTHPEGSYRLDIPIPAPEKIICVGVNFPSRNEEYKDGQSAPDKPSLFVRFSRSFTGHGQPLIRPKASHQLDYEGELAVVIGKRGRHIPQNMALDHIAALTICNDGTLRDWVRHAKFNVTQGKNFDRSGAIGPWLVPHTHPAQVTDIRLQTRVNGEIRQDDRTGRMIFPVAEQIAYISTFTTLVPGDIVVTGTPTGAGARLDPPQFLAPGDTVEVEVEGIGTLFNTIEDEA